MAIEEINITLDRVEEMLENEESIGIIKENEDMLNRCIDLFNMILVIASNDEDLPDPVGECTVG